MMKNNEQPVHQVTADHHRRRRHHAGRPVLRRTAAL